MRHQCFSRNGSLAHAKGRNATPPGLYLPGPSVAVGHPSTLATYLAYQRVRASSSVQVRTRTGRIRPLRYILYRIGRTV
uniref:Uncharacterized protein n=1 Tax=Candidatus Kentrum sp. FM TaxID=2126340 RepID=A0A450TUM1_9GAMM|nr:MAG: hypothetical protein BECKFM1743C_GA0114222_106492 [Candidatus Kentron sp. FM]VFJ72667.1 MAG: hypothetical protein BECKFM1743A_GA0114220_106582 [Candidatus Kentron sp. FM]VFK19800.1 MAG: hypothetical protein BECKFM1743B_GA0114221_106462 [Candidatus Kentron sp. FM]